MCVLILSITSARNISHYKKKRGRCDQKCVLVFMWSTLYCQILLKIEFSQPIFEKYHISNFVKIRSVGAEFLHAERQTDRHDEANCRFSHFRECAFELKDRVWILINQETYVCLNTQIVFFCILIVPMPSAKFWKHLRFKNGKNKFQYGKPRNILPIP
jgi:hypothetical protein